MTFSIRNFFGGMTPGWQDLSERDQQAIARRSLLASGLGMLSARTGGNFGASLAQGLQTGLLAADEGRQNIENTRYKNEILARTRQGMERNQAIEDAQRNVFNSDGSLNDDGLAAWRQVDPVGAQNFVSEYRKGNQPSQPFYVASGDGSYESPYVWQGDKVVPLSNFVKDTGPPIRSGFLAPDLGAGSAAPTLGRDMLPMYEQAVERVESSGNPFAISPKGALGPMQTMPGTLRDPGFGVVPARNSSPEEMRRVGQDYLGAMFGKYGSPDLSLAAYNWGPGNLDRALAASGGNPQQALASAPAETQDYIRKVGAQLAQANPQQAPGARPWGARAVEKKTSSGPAAPSGYRYTTGGTLEPIPGGPADRRSNPTPGDMAQAEMGLRKEYSERIKSPQVIVTAYNQIDQAARNPSAPNDLALIFSYMRMLDPTSVVREGEFANAQNAAGVPDRVRNAYNRAINGERLNPEQRASFVSSAKGLRDQAQQSIDQFSDQYADLASQYGYSPDRIVGKAKTHKPAVPPQAIEYLLQNPASRVLFEQKYGVSADEYLR